MRRVELERLSPPQLVLLDRAAAEIRPEFNALVDGLYPPANDPALLLHGSLSRSPFVSRLFLDCCRLALVEALLAKEGLDEIVTESGALAAVLREKLGAKARVVRRLNLRAELLRRLRPGARIAKALLRFARLWAAGRGAPQAPPRGPIVLLDTFLLPDSLRGGAFYDRYYTGWQEFLSPEERARIYYLPELPEDGDPAALIAQARASGERFLFKESYLRAGDYLAAFLSPLRGLAADKRPRRFRGFDVAPLLRADAKHVAWNAQSLSGELNRRFARRLKEAGVELSLVVDWSENQLLDRGLVLGIRASYPGVPISGYAGYIVSPVRHLYTRPTRRERDAGVIPDRLHAVGRGLVEGFREFCPGLDAAAAPAFRFRGVWREPARSQARARPALLLALPISLEGALDILTLAASARLPPGWEDARFTIKAHPALPLEKIRARFPGSWPRTFEFAGGDFADCLESSDLLIGNTSSTCVEALARGVPAVVAASANGLTENPIPDWVCAELWRLVRGPEELSRALAELLTKDPVRLDRRARLARELREQCFEPVDAIGVRRLFRLERTSGGS